MVSKKSKSIKSFFRKIYKLLKLIDLKFPYFKIKMTACLFFPLNYPFLYNFCLMAFDQLVF